ncbi:MAG: peptidoglycan DD-metalloendopeptidase family protein [Magnetospirillum sp. WYHS-4]
MRWLSPNPSENRRPIRWLSLVLPVALLAWAPCGLSAADPAKRLEEVEKALEQERSRARALEREASGLDVDLGELRNRMVEAAAAIQEHEEEVLHLEERLGVIAREEREKAKRIDFDRDRFAQVLAALARMARHPPEALVAQPLSPVDTVRSALLLRAALPQIENRAKRLRRELADLTGTRRDMELRQTELAALRRTLDGERHRLDGMLARKASLRQKAATAIDESLGRAGELAGEVESLRELLARLERERLEREEARRRALAAKAKPGPAEEPADEGEPVATPNVPRAALEGRPIAKAKGSLVFPVVGEIDGYFGDHRLPGSAVRRGITIRTRVGAQVVAPYGGLVVFADQFRGYGRLLIIEHSGGYHTLLAGLGRVDGGVGQTVKAGEPIGTMGRPEDGKPSLYVELRRRGQPIDPLPWLAARKGKDNG